MFSAHQKNAVHHCDLVKSIDKDIIVILGGIHPSLFPKESIPQRRQELPKTYSLNGAIYIAETQYLKNKKSFLSNETHAFVMPTERSIDIDTIEDFEEASRLLKYIDKKI
jgi:CMP-N-acetylneuraminic acid synthetase